MEEPLHHSVFAVCANAGCCPWWRTTHRGVEENSSAKTFQIVKSYSFVFTHALSPWFIWIHKELLDEVRLMRHGKGEALKGRRRFLTSHSYNKGKKGPFCFQCLSSFKWIIPSTCLPNDCMSALALFQHIIAYSLWLWGHGPVCSRSELLWFLWPELQS